MKTYQVKYTLLFGMCLVFLSCTKTYTDEEINKLFEPITSRYGIKVVYKISDEFLSSTETTMPFTGPNRNSIVKPINLRILAKYPDLLQHAFEKYPVKVIREYLKAICFAKEINEDGFTYAGSYDVFRKIIYLANDGSQDNDYSIGAFHHEFSSLLLNRRGLLLNSWIDQNPKDFDYLYKTYGNFKNLQNFIEIKVDGSSEDYKKGFLSTYSQTNFENDFNEYARLIFTHPQKFKKIMNQYPRVRGKFLLFLEFYHKIDPIFTEEYLLGKN
jgi:hypothetical protein